jgi:hypothetical protein
MLEERRRDLVLEVDAKIRDARAENTCDRLHTSGLQHPSRLSTVNCADFAVRSETLAKPFSRARFSRRCPRCNVSL